MPQKPIETEELQRRYDALKRCGGQVAAAARALNMNRSTMQHSTREMVRRGFDMDSIAPAKQKEYPHRIPIEIENGIVLVGSDCHYWPGVVTTAHRAFLKFCRDMKPKTVILNGDVLDGARISKHAPIGWEKRPQLVDEMEACKARLFEIEKVTRGCKRIWSLGNHDARFETFLATVAPEYAKIHGVHLKDHFPDWTGCWSVWINDCTVVKHRFRSGIHAPWNNTMWAGRTIVTGHLHSQKVYPLSDYNGTRWGVDTGTLAEPYGPQFTDYTEDSPVNWRSGFGVLTYWKGRLLTPELVRVIDDDMVEFRGKVIGV